MLKNYLAVAIRSLFKHRLYSAINIVGLSAGIAVSVLILIFVSHEFSFDRFHKRGERIFRAEKVFSRDGRHSLFANPQFAPDIKEIAPVVVNYVRLFEPGRKAVKSDDAHHFFEDRFIFADTSFFSIFSFELIKGERKLLSRPNTVVITEETARKYFNTVDAMGKTITFDKVYAFEVVGISRNAPSNSSLQFDFVASFSSLLQIPSTREMLMNNASGYPSYLLLRSKDDVTAVNESIRKTSYSNASVTYSLAPLFETHLNLNFGDTSNTRYVFIFLCVAILILSLALINYMNLATARGMTRAKEVGVRKVIGANRRTLSVQFYLESAIVTSISFALAVVLIEIFNPLFLNLLNIDIDDSFFKSPLLLAVIGSLLLISILISGSYPALVLSQFKPIDVLKGKLNGGQRGKIRKVLTVFQFSVSIGLIICTLVMGRQLKYLQSKQIGFDREQIMAIPIDRVPPGAFERIKTTLSNQAGILGVASASIPLFKTDLSGVSLVQSPVTQEKIGTKWIIVDREFLNVLGIEWNKKPDGNPIGQHVINETAANAFGLHRRPDEYDLTMGDSHPKIIQGKIAGIVKDFNYQNLRSKIEPLIVTIMDSVYQISGEATLYVRIDRRLRLDEKVDFIKSTYEKYIAEMPFSYYFLDDAFNELQKGEERMAKLFKVFSFVAMSIAGLGLFGLVAFTAERRRKEISIRKVLGASLRNVLVVLSGETVILIAIGMLIGSPVAWFVMNDWLSNFFYQVDIPLWYFILAGASAVLLAVAVICMYGIRAAMTNPTKHLSSE